MYFSPLKRQTDTLLLSSPVKLTLLSAHAINYVPKARQTAQFGNKIPSDNVEEKAMLNRTSLFLTRKTSGTLDSVTHKGKKLINTSYLQTERGESIFYRSLSFLSGLMRSRLMYR